MNSPEAGDNCECGGTYEYEESENCSCHISPPCDSCLEVELICSDCGEYATDD